MSRIADETRAACLRAVWFARPVAGASLCRVLGKAARVRLGALGGRVRRARSGARSCVEGTWAAPAGAGGRHTRREHRHAPGGGRPRARARRPRARVAARRRPCASPCDRARADVGRSGRGRSRATSRTSSSAWALPRRASPQRARKRERVLRGRVARLRRGRRLHVRRDRRRLRVGVPTGRSESCGGDHVRAGRPLD